MSDPDISFIRRRMNHILMTVLITLIPTATVAIWSGISDHFELRTKASREYVDASNFSMQVMLTKYIATVDLYMTASEKDREKLWKQLEELRTAMNDVIRQTDVTRGIVQKVE